MGRFLMLLGDDLLYLSWPLPTLGKSGIHFWSGSTHKVDSVTAADRVIMRVKVGRGNLQFYVGSEVAVWYASLS
jgi:hypothetical protein